MAATPPPDARSFELFKLCLELADRTTARRAGANTFFVSLHSVVASVVGYLAAIQHTKEYDRFSLAVLALVGVVLSLTWWALLRYYRRLAKAKWDVINDMETELPAQPFMQEWSLLHPDEVKGKAPRSWRQRNRHREATVVEQVVPLTFAAVYLLLGLKVACG